MTLKYRVWLNAIGMAGATLLLVNSCKKDGSDPPATHNGIKTPFTEEFLNVNELLTMDWMMINNSTNAVGDWSQGYSGASKYSGWYGFTAFSYSFLPDEFAYSAVLEPGPISVSSWLISPVLNIKNGDKISFYARGDTTDNIFEDRLQVRINKSMSSNVGNSVSSIGSFKELLIDINPKQERGVFPMNWKKYEFVFSGISGDLDTRIAFRHYAINGKNLAGVGIDLFKFEVQ